LTVKDFKASAISRGRDHWDLKKWQTQVVLYMEEKRLGPVTPRNVDGLILILRSTIVKKKTFQKTADKQLLQHFLALFNEPTIARIRGFFRNESLSKSLWLAHISHGRLEKSIEVFIEKNPESNMTKHLLRQNLWALGAPVDV
jgi:hypothetical protein